MNVRNRDPRLISVQSVCDSHFAVWSFCDARFRPRGGRGCTDRLAQCTRRIGKPGVDVLGQVCLHRGVKTGSVFLWRGCADRPAKHGCADPQPECLPSTALQKGGDCAT